MSLEKSSFYLELCKIKRAPVTLYHGTSSKFLPKILKHGLEDRKDNSVWNTWNTRQETRKPKPFKWKTRGAGPTLPGIYAATRVGTAHEFADAATGSSVRHPTGNHLYVEIHTHPRALHPDDDKVANSCRQAHEGTVSKTLREDLHKPRNTSLRRQADLVARSRAAFSDHVLKGLGLHTLPEKKKSYLRDILNKIHDSNQRLKSLQDKTYIRQFRAIPNSNSSLPFEADPSLRGKAVQDALDKEHFGHYRPAIKEFSDAVTWNKTHGLSDPESDARVPNRILSHRIGYRGPTRISGIFEMEPSAVRDPADGRRKIKGHYIKTHYSEHKDDLGTSIPNEAFIKGAQDARYNVLGLKDKEGKIISNF